MMKPDGYTFFLIVYWGGACDFGGVECIEYISGMCIDAGFPDITKTD